MKNFPEHLNSRQDYEYVRKHFSPNQWEPVWRDLLDSRFLWIDIGTLVGDIAGVTDDTHRVVEFPNPEDASSTIRMQQAYIEDENAPIFRLGFTVAEVEAALDDFPTNVGQAKAPDPNLEATPELVPEQPPEQASVSEPTYLLNASGTYHSSGCGYASASAEVLTLAQIAAKNPKAKPCSRCDAPAMPVEQDGEA